jgi:hypothetical protein
MAMPVLSMILACPISPPMAARRGGQAQARSRLGQDAVSQADDGDCALGSNDYREAWSARHLSRNDYESLVSGHTA